MYVYQYLFIFACSLIGLTTILTCFAIKRRCQQLKFWAVFTFVAFLIFSLLSIIFLSIFNYNKSHVLICNSLDKTSSEYYLECEKNLDLYCQKVDSGEFSKSIVYCNNCLLRIMSSPNYSPTSKKVVNENYEKCIVSFV
jgi:hypothetical protein